MLIRPLATMVISMEKKEVFYCYSMPLMHFLKAHGINYLYEGYNKKSRYPYFAFERTEILGKALSMWEEFKKTILTGENIDE